MALTALRQTEVTTPQIPAYVPPTTRTATRLFYGPLQTAADAAAQGSAPGIGERRAIRRYLVLEHADRLPVMEVFGTARSRQGRAVCARRRKIFSGFEKIFRRASLTARTVYRF